MDIREDLVQAAREIGATIREHADEGERRRRLAPPVWQALRRAGLFRLTVPRSLGGHEVDPLTFARVVAETARHDSAAGWALQANMAPLWGWRLPDEGAEEVWADPDVVIAAAFFPPVEARAVDGGFVLNGRRPLASTIHDADWLMLTALHGEGMIAAFLRTADVEVADTWESLGMRSTDSNDVIASDVFVPARRTFPMAPGAPRGAHFQGPLYRLRAAAVTAIFGAPLALAIAREAIEEVKRLAAGKHSMGHARVLAERPVAQARIARAEGLVRAAWALFADTIEASWARALAGVEPTLEQKADDLLAVVHANLSAAEAVDLVYGLAGSAGVYARNRIERHLRDVQTIRHHGLFCESRLETVGQVMLGLPPEFELVHF